VISGILPMLKIGCHWQDTLSTYGPHTTIHNRYNRWSQRGVWQRLFAKIAAAGSVPDELMLDASHEGPSFGRRRKRGVRRVEVSR
jgi:transposase